MSRILNIDLPESEVIRICAKLAIDVVSIEPLTSGGTHIIFFSNKDAERLCGAINAHLIKGVVRRFPFYGARLPW